MFKRFIACSFLVAIVSPLCALSGTEIIRNADDYLTLRWYCNVHNAREIVDSNGNIIRSNRDEDPANNILEYPFYPRGAGYLDERGIPQESTGQHTGMPYAWGLRETVGMFSGSDGRSGKLIGENNGRRMLAGNHDNTYQKPQLPSLPCVMNPKWFIGFRERVGERVRG